jgi:hypothetical protein
MGKQERERTIVITAYNQDRHAINHGVRTKLQQLGEISANERSREIFISKGWTRAEMKEAQYYGSGDVVRFGRNYQLIDAANGEYMRVQRIDAPRGVVYLEKANGSVVPWQPKKHNKVEVYRAENRDIANGDLIRMTRKDGEFKNGEVGRVVAINGSVATLEVKQGNVIGQTKINLERSKHWDYAYSSTVHASQGATQYRTLFHIQTPEHQSEKKQEKELKAMANVFGDRSFYVGSTRASHEIRIFTNSKRVALEVVAAKQDKTSAVEQIDLGKQSYEQKMR